MGATGIRSAYGVDLQTLVNQLKQATARARDSGAETLKQALCRRSYIRGAISARLEGVEPPIDAGDIVEAKPDCGLPGGTKVVDRVYYHGRNRWTALFKGDASPYIANLFTKIGSARLVVARHQELLAA